MENVQGENSRCQGTGSREWAPESVSGLTGVPGLASLDSEGTTVQRPEATEDYWSDLEHVWARGRWQHQGHGFPGAHEIALGLRNRAKYHASVARALADDPENFSALRAARASALWATSRARTMTLERRTLVQACGGRWRIVRCGCGDVQVPVGCDQTQLCGVCRRRHWKRWNRRLTLGLDDKLARAVAAWGRGGGRGKRPGVYLVTFTVPHTDDLVADRRRLGKAWRHVYKAGHASGWLNDYAATYETTPGRDGKGHVHLHAAIIARWLPYAELHAEWALAMPGGLHPDVQAPKGSDTASTAAGYLASYVTKGVDPGEFTGEKAAELLLAFRGRRKVTTSVGFYRVARVRPCDECGVLHRTVSMPTRLHRHAIEVRWASHTPWMQSSSPPQKSLPS